MNALEKHIFVSHIRRNRLATPVGIIILIIEMTELYKLMYG